MSVELATGYVTLLPSAKGFKSKLTSEIRGVGTSAGDQIGDDLGRSLSSKISSVLTSIGALAIKSGAIIAAAGAGLGAWGLKSAADLQQTQIAFEGVLGSSVAADKFIGEMRAFAAKTPFELPGLTKAAQQLLGVGFAAESVIPTMTTIGNVTAALGVSSEGIDRTVRALGQMKGRGKVASQELIQISEAIPGFSAIGAIAEHFGVTTAEAFDMVEDGAVGANEGITAILEGMAKFPGAAGAMERQALTLNGVLSTFKDTVRDALVKGIAPFLPAVATAVSTAMPQIGAAVGSLGATFGKLLSSAVPLVEKLLPIVVKIADGISTLLVHAFDLLLPIIEALAPQFDNLLAALLPLVDQFITELAPIIAKLAPAVLELATHFATALLPIIQDLAPVAMILADVFVDLVDAMGPSGAAAVIAAAGVFKLAGAMSSLGSIVGLGALGPIGLSIGLVAGAVYGLSQAFGDNTVKMELNLQKLRELNQEQLVQMIHKIQEVSDKLGENNLVHEAFRTILEQDVVQAQRFIDALNSQGIKTDWYLKKLDAKIKLQSESSAETELARQKTDALREAVDKLQPKVIPITADTSQAESAVDAIFGKVRNFGFGISVKSFEQTAKGGLFDTPQIRSISEGGAPEAVLPLNDPARSWELIAQSGLMDSVGSAQGGGFSIEHAYFGDRDVIADLDYFTRTRMAGV